MNTFKINAGTTFTRVVDHTGSVEASYKYVFVSDSARFEWSGSYANNQISVTALTSVTSKLLAGVYIWSLVEVINGETTLIDQGRATVTSDLLNASTAQVLTHNEKMLTSIRKRLEGRVLSDHENYSIEGRSLSRIPMDTLKTLENKYAWRVYREQTNRGERPKHKSIRFR
ncbi:hypothetical protein [Glaciecola sp. KUL10]|uniref:hypothetical protein n=1 Tax=Glaciecola sp. (strain KUL10) TaxID=2161813 RepID=UPI000D78B8DA|nr:hypothetical protein [Glaciecola sp. KUL10]GBL02939.1 phage-related protein [Glaciecola sp. KUL10]